MPVPIKKSSSSAPAAPLTPEQKIKALEVQLQEANEKAQLFEAVLDVLKKDYGVRVVNAYSGERDRRFRSIVTGRHAC